MTADYRPDQRYLSAGSIEPLGDEAAEHAGCAVHTNLKDAILSQRAGLAKVCC